MYRPGSFVATHLTPIEDEQIQPNGVDLTLDSVYTQTGAGAITTDGKEIGDREELTPEDEQYELEPGAYIVQYGEQLAIPDGHVGFVYPRSSLMRNSAMLNTAVWDAGYEGRGEGLLAVNAPITIEQGARIGQIVYAEAEHADVYDGSYQGENLE